MNQVVKQDVSTELDAVEAAIVHHPRYEHVSFWDSGWFVGVVIGGSIAVGIGVGVIVAII